MKRIHNDGYALPLVILSLLIFSVLAFMITLRFIGTGEKEYMKGKKDYPLYEEARSGIERALFELKRPDNTANAHPWTDNYKDDLSFEINNTSVTVKIEDISINKE